MYPFFGSSSLFACDMSFDRAPLLVTQYRHGDYTYAVFASYTGPDLRVRGHRSAVQEPCGNCGNPCFDRSQGVFFCDNCWSQMSPRERLSAWVGNNSPPVATPSSGSNPLTHPPLPVGGYEIPSETSSEKDKKPKPKKNAKQTTNRDNDKRDEKRKKDEDNFEDKSGKKGSKRGSMVATGGSSKKAR